MSWKYLSSWARLPTGVPFQIGVPSKSISRSTTTGGVVGGGGLACDCGRSNFTACVWIGMVMINMTRSTSMTSINGVVFISTMTSFSPPADPTLIDMARNLSCPNSEYLLFGVGDESNLQHRRALQIGEHPANGFETRILIATDMDLRLWHFHRNILEHVEQHVVFDRRVVPIIIAVLVDRDRDVLRLGDGHDVGGHRKSNRH